MPGRWPRTLLLLAGFWPVALLSMALAAEPAEGAKPWLFFDLGDTVIRTPSDPQTHDGFNFHWMRFKDADGTPTDSHAYLTKLAKLGYKIGMITNIPQEWGDPELKKAKAWLAETDPEKRAHLAMALTEIKRGVIADFFQGKGPGDPADHPRRWNDPLHPDMEWGMFPLNLSLIPFLTEYRKPDHGPPTSDRQLYLFAEAVHRAARAGARALYQGENKFEVAAAQQAGMLGHLAVFKATQDIQDKGFLLSPAEIDHLVHD
jgi:hypothetical protein